MSGRIWIALGVSLLPIVAMALASQALRGGFERWNTAFLGWFVSIRRGWLTTLILGLNAGLVSRWTVRLLRLATVLALLRFRRWRHLLVFLGSIVAVEVLAYQLTILVASPRPWE